MKIKMKILGWIFLILYTVIIIGLIAAAYFKYSVTTDWPFKPIVLKFRGQLFWTIVTIVATFATQGLLIFGSGTVNVCQPIRKQRLLIPVIVASFMMTVLLWALMLSLSEVFHLCHYLDFNKTIALLWMVLGLSWLVWAIVFFIWFKESERYKAFRGLLSAFCAKNTRQNEKGNSACFCF